MNPSGQPDHFFTVFLTLPFITIIFKVWLMKKKIPNLHHIFAFQHIVSQCCCWPFGSCTLNCNPKNVLTIFLLF